MADTPATAVFFHLDALEGKGRDLVGRRSAGQSFLRGYLRNVGTETLHFIVEGDAGARDCAAVLRGLGETRPVQVGVMHRGIDFAGAGTIFFPTPSMMNMPWLRQRHDPAACSLVGITHTVSTRRMIESFHAQMSEPIEPWDAIICTSRAVRSVLRRQLDLETEYFRQRFGATRVPLPQLPVIPLGIEAADFTVQPDARARMRAAQGTPDDAVVVMTLGRLSVVEKANPLPLFLALEQIARQLDRPLHLWMVGWASRPEEEALHREGAATICKHVTFRLIDGRDPDVRRNIWAGADVFTLPSDSIQETYGLVPVEAMAAGLPVVMPDWDGFRDTVRHGETGFLVPTRMAPPGHGKGLAARFADKRDGYLHYLTLVQARVQIDVPAYTQALGHLITQPDLRRRMGQAGQDHVRANLDWSAIIPRYLDLARELAATRQGARPTTPRLASGPVNPLEVDPYDLYADYPTARFDAATPVCLRQHAAHDLLAVIDKLSGRILYKRHSASYESIDLVCQSLAAGPASCVDLAERLGMPQEQVVGIVLQLAKSDLVRLPPIQPRDAARGSSPP